MSGGPDETSKGRVVLLTAGDGDEWRELQAHLTSSGWRVDPVDVTPRVGPPPSLPLLEGVDLAILHVAGSDEGLADSSARRLVHLAGILQGRLGERRVLVVVEERVAGLMVGTGVGEVRYGRSRIASRFPHIVSRLAELSAPPPPVRSRSRVDGALARVGVAELPVAPELMVIVGLLTIAVAAAVGFVVLNVDRDPEVSSTTAETVDDPLGPAADPLQPGRAAGLPSRCVIDVTAGAVIPREIACEGAGGIVADGFFGPWHTELAAMTLDGGVVAEVLFGAGPDPEDTALIELVAGGRHSVRPEAGTAAATQVVLVFSANNQEVTFHQADDRGAAQLRFVFRLDV